MADDVSPPPAGTVPASPGPLHPDTLTITAGRADNDVALAPVVWTSSAFETPSFSDAARMAHSAGPTRFYGRYGNPGVAAFEDAIARLEGAEAARAFSSGMGAVFACVFTLCSPGSHIVAQSQLYGGTNSLLTGVCPRFGIDVTFVDGTRPGAFAEAVRPGKTMLVFAETPANPWVDIVDLDEVGGLAPFTVVDSTLATPLGQQPLAHGVNLVLHSATKAIAGHNDATLGVVAGEQDLIDWIWGFSVLQGANASPYDANNGLRGLRSLGPRFRQQTDTAITVATWLEARPDVTRVAHPGLASHPQAHLAARQMRLTGGVLAFDLAGGAAAGRAFVDHVGLCRQATSLGGPETLVTHPASTTHAGMTDEELADCAITPGTIRLSAGLEHADDVIADLAQALAGAAVAH